MPNTARPSGIEPASYCLNCFRGGNVHRARKSFDLAGLMDQLGVARPTH